MTTATTTTTPPTAQVMADRIVRRNEVLKMLGIENENIDSEHLKLVIEKHKDTINWPNFYAYFDERLRMEKDKPVGITSRDDVEYVLARLEPYRSELCVVYNAY